MPKDEGLLTKSRSKEERHTSKRRHFYAAARGDCVLVLPDFVVCGPQDEDTRAAYKSSSAAAEAEAHAHAQAPFKNCNYSMSSLVLSTDSRPWDTREPAGEGEPETLWGRLDFGDRAVQAKAPGLEERLTRSREKKDRDSTSPSAEAADGDVHLPRRRRSAAAREQAVLSLADGLAYNPRTEETRATSEAMLSVIQDQFGGKPMDVLRGVAHKVLNILKNNKIKLLNPIPTQKFKQFVSMGTADGVDATMDDDIGVAVEFQENDDDEESDFDQVQDELDNDDDEMFEQFVSIRKLITDFHDASDSVSAPSGDLGVAVKFEEDDDVEESDFDQVQVKLDEDDDDVAELNRPGGMQMAGELHDDDMQNSNEGLNVKMQHFGAYWLQRQITQAYADIDPHQSQKLAEEILKIIAEGDDRDDGNHLVLELDYEKFDLIKLVLCNRFKIVWCTRLARAEDQEERKKEEMVGNPSSVPILKQLHATRESAKERQKNLEKSIRVEAKRLLNNDSAGADGLRERRAVDRDMESGWLKGQRQLLDLDNLSFDQGGLLMANKKCELPDGSLRTIHKGYEEVHAPALKPSPYGTNEKIVKISDIPATWAQPASAGMQQLNRVQSKVYDATLFKPDNILLCAPPGAGKTNVAVLTILDQIGLHMKDDEFDSTKYKIVYVAPVKALVAEVVGNLAASLQDFGLTVRELSGDQNLTEQQIEETHVIATTPEKWDIVTRKSGDRTYTQMVKLLIMDEIHLLRDNREPVLESIVSKTVRQIEISKEHILLVSLSATLQNYEDDDVFLRVRSKGICHFDNIYRPCPLAQQYIGITVRTPLKRFQLMNEICYEKEMAAAGKHQVLMFAHSRKETAKTARAIRDTALADDTLTCFLKDDSASQEILGSQEELVKCSDLEDLLPHGFQNAAPKVAKPKPKADPNLGSPIAVLLLLLVIFGGGMGVAADAHGARCDARSLSMQLSSHCEATVELQSKACCDAIFATLGRNGCLCKVVQEPEFRSSGMAGGSIIVQMYYSCNGGPYVSPDAEEECDNVGSPPPLPPPPPPPPSTAKEDRRLPRHTFWRKAGWTVGAFVLFVLGICGCWTLYARTGSRWSARGSGRRLNEDIHWWSGWVNKLKEAAQAIKSMMKQVVQEGKDPVPAPMFAPPAPAPLFAHPAPPPLFAPPAPPAVLAPPAPPAVLAPPAPAPLFAHPAPPPLFAPPAPPAVLAHPAPPAVLAPPAPPPVLAPLMPPPVFAPLMPPPVFVPEQGFVAPVVHLELVAHSPCGEEEELVPPSPHVTEQEIDDESPICTDDEDEEDHGTPLMRKEVGRGQGRTGV